MGFEAQQAVVITAGAAGDGIVARYPGLVCVARSADPRPLRQLLDLCSASAGTDPGRLLARRLAVWLTGPDAPGEELVFGTIAAAGDRFAVFLSGAVEVVVPEHGVSLSGTHAAAWTDRLLDHPAAPIVIALDGAQASAGPDPGHRRAALYDLRGGVVPGVGVVLVPAAAAPAADSAGPDSAGPDSAGPDVGGPDVAGPDIALYDVSPADTESAVPAGSAAVVASGGEGAPDGEGSVDWFADAGPLPVDSVGDQPPDAGSVDDGADPGAPDGGRVDRAAVAQPVDVVEPAGGAAAADVPEANGFADDVAAGSASSGSASSGSASSTGRHVLLLADDGAGDDGAGGAEPAEHAEYPAADAGDPPPDGPRAGEPPATQDTGALPSTAAFRVEPGDEESAELRLPSRARGVQCSRGHLSDPRSPVCVQCGVAMGVPPGPLVTGVRPPLGLLVFDDGATYTVDAEYLVGRLPESDPRVRSGVLVSIVVEDRSGAVSRAHAEIRIVGWDVVIQDSGSRNGTFVAEPGESGWTPVPVSSQQLLVPGARVRIGGRTFVFEPPAGVG